MSTNGKLIVEKGSVSAIVPPGAAVDAAVLDTIAGFELPLEQVTVFIGEQSDRRHALTLSVSLPPEIMLHLALRILEVSGSPAFTEGEWRLIAMALRGSVPANPDPHTGGARINEFAQRIEDAYS